MSSDDELDQEYLKNGSESQTFSRSDSNSPNKIDKKASRSSSRDSESSHADEETNFEVKKEYRHRPSSDEEQMDGVENSPKLDHPVSMKEESADEEEKSSSMNNGNKESSRSRSRSQSRDSKRRQIHKSQTRSRSRKRSHSRSSSRTRKRSRSSRRSRSRSRRRSRSPRRRSTRSPRRRRRSRSRGRRSRSRSATPADGARLHVAELDVETRKRDLEKLYEKYGRLREIWMARNPPCFAFVVFNRQRDADRALRETDGMLIGHCRIKVTQARPRVRGGRFRGGSGYDPNLRCYQCGELGHFSRNCTDTKFGYKRPPTPPGRIRSGGGGGGGAGAGGGGIRPSRRRSRSRSRS